MENQGLGGEKSLGVILSGFLFLISFSFHHCFGIRHSSFLFSYLCLVHYDPAFLISSATTKFNGIFPFSTSSPLTQANA